MNYKKNIKGHKPSSRIRYEERNPVFSVRMPLQWHNELKTLMEDTVLSKRDFLAVVLERQILNYEHMKDRYLNEGIEIGKTRNTARMCCNICQMEGDIPLDQHVLKSLYENSKKYPLFNCTDCKKNYQF